MENDELAMFECLEAVRKDGSCNMVDIGCVLAVASRTCDVGAYAEIYTSNRNQGYADLLVRFGEWLSSKGDQR